MGGRVMSERPSVWGELPPDGTVLSTAEYLQTAESMRVQELFYGKLRVEESTHFRHQNLLLELAVLMRVFVGQYKLGTVCIAPQDVILDPARAPDLVVEVMSPHPRIGTLEERIRCFAQYGVRECWLIHQLSREIEVLRFKEHDANARRMFRGVQRIESSVLPDFGLSPEVLACW